MYEKCGYMLSVLFTRTKNTQAPLKPAYVLVRKSEKLKFLEPFHLTHVNYYLLIFFWGWKHASIFHETK